MLPNSESIPAGIRLADTFAAMVAELPWPNLRSYILANNQLAKLSTLGGYRLEPKHRKRFEALLLKEAEKSEFSSTFCNPVFAQWYPVHETLYKTLEDYFHSDVYKAFREERTLSEDAYVLSDEVFARVFQVDDLEKWRILLCFSPLQLTQEQADRVLNSAAGNEALLRRLKDNDAALDALRRENAQLAGEAERVKAQVDGSSNELQELRKARRDLTAERGDLQNKFDASQAENRKLRQQVAQLEAEQEARRSEQASSFQQERQRLESTLAKLEKEVVEWRTRYEAQRAEFRDMRELQVQTDTQLSQERTHLKERERRIQELCTFGDLVLARMDWVQAGKNLHLTPALQRQFNSIIKKLNYEAGKSTSIDTSLPVFWDKLMAQEKHLMDQVAQSNTLEVAHGTADDFWNSLKESFDDVIIGLEARLMLMRVLREVFYQVLELSDLQAPNIPVSAAPKK